MSEQPLEPKPVEDPAELVEPSTNLESPHADEMATSLGGAVINQAPAEDARPNLSKAWDMAHAGKEDRDAAAEARSIANTLRNTAPEEREEMLRERNDIVQPFRKAHDEIVDKLRQEYPDIKRDEDGDPVFDPSNPRYMEHQQKRGDLIGEPGISGSLADDVWNKLHEGTKLGQVLTNPETEIYDNLHDAAINEFEDEWVDLEKSVFDKWADSIDKNVSEWRDQIAERSETWAGILHDNPPTEAFKRQFDMEDVSVEAVVQLERKCDIITRSIEKTREAVDTLLERPAALLGDKQVLAEILLRISYGIAPEPHNYSLGSNIPRESDDHDENKNIWLERLADGKKLMTYAFGENSKEAIEWQGLTVDPNATFFQLRDKYKSALHQIMKPSMDAGKITLAVLEQIRNGNASRWQ